MWQELHKKESIRGPAGLRPIPILYIKDPDEAETVMAMATEGLENNGRWCDRVQRGSFKSNSPGSTMIHVSSIAHRLEDAHKTLIRLGMCKC